MCSKDLCDLCDATFTESSLAVQYPCVTHQGSLTSDTLPRHAVNYFSKMTSPQNKNCGLRHKTLCVKQSNEPNMKNSGVVSVFRRQTLATCYFPWKYHRPSCWHSAFLGLKRNSGMASSIRLRDFVFDKLPILA